MLYLILGLLLAASYVVVYYAGRHNALSVIDKIFISWTKQIEEAYKGDDQD